MLEGKKIELVSINEADSAFMVSLLNDQRIARMEGKNEMLISMDQQRAWVEKNKLSKSRLSLIIFEKTEKKRVGYISFKYVNQISRIGHVGIKIQQNSQGLGYGSDALRTLTDYLFCQLNIHRLQSTIVEFNKPSINLFVKKFGWKIEGQLRKSVYSEGRYFDQLIIGLLRSDFETSPKK
ncbi:GNAT family N-acetyltransferase [Akkermansiaceae bacterium]|nr:GNAT family N-acetyltransferase [Akkermansiaceae bacterium]